MSFTFYIENTELLLLFVMPAKSCFLMFLLIACRLDIVLSWQLVKESRWTSKESVEAVRWLQVSWYSSIKPFFCFSGITINATQLCQLCHSTKLTSCLRWRVCVFFKLLPPGWTTFSGSSFVLSLRWFGGAISRRMCVGSNNKMVAGFADGVCTWRKKKER